MKDTEKTLAMGRNLSRYPYGGRVFLVDAAPALSREDAYKMAMGFTSQEDPIL